MPILPEFHLPNDKGAGSGTLKSNCTESQFSDHPNHPVYFYQFNSLSAPGETVEIAEEMAARDALRRIFRTDDTRPLLPMGDQASWKRGYPRGCVKLR